MKTILPFFLISVFSFSITFSQQVTPNERVQTSLNVRDVPSSAGNVIGSLLPGETATLIADTIPYWYQIAYDQDTGYIHKAWSVLLLAVPNGKSDLVIGSWNIKWFGSSSSDQHDYPAMIDIIGKMDVLAIQEIKGQYYFDRLDTLLAGLKRRGYDYDYVVSDETGYDKHPDPGKNNYVERYAFLWDSGRLELLHPDTPYYFIDTPFINNPYFRAVPVMADFRVKREGGFDFRIVTVHTVFNKEIQEVRGTEIKFLHDWMNAQVFSPEVPEKDIFIMGDFNANPEGQTAYFDSILTDTTAYRIIFNEPLLAGEASKRTTILRKQDPTGRDHQLPVYDHLLLSKHTTYAIPIYPVTWASGIIGVEAFDQEGKFAGIQDRYEIISAMSDHRPIWIRLPYDAEDRD